MTRSDSVSFVGLRFDPLDLPATIRWIAKACREDVFSYVVTPNVDHIVRLENQPDATIRAAYEAADLTLCDSRVLSRMAWISGLELWPTPGSDVTTALLMRSTVPRSIAVVGGRPLIHAALETRFPSFEWHFLEPPMGVLHNPAARRAIARFVEATQADVTMFVMGSPQSELCCHEIAQAGRARGVGLCVGASLEFLIGTKRRAPVWLQVAGLEWLFRLTHEPTRLWRRYMIDGPRIFAIWRRWRAQR